MTDNTLTDEAAKIATLARFNTAHPELEEGLSIKDWADRVRDAIKLAFQAARAGEAQVEFELWTDAAAVCLGRMEQLMRFDQQANCAHKWPASRNATDRCTHCGLMLGETL